MSAGNIYGNTIVEPGAFAHLGNVEQRVNVHGGVHLHYRTEEAESLQGVLRALEGTQGGAADFQDAIGHLKALSTIFRQAERIESSCGSNDRQNVESLCAITADTSARLREFHEQLKQLQRLNHSPHTVSPQPQHSDLGQVHVSTRGEVSRLQLYADRQLQKINAILQFMLRATTQQIANASEFQHQSLVLKAQEQATAIKELGEQFQPFARDMKESRQATFELLASLKSTRDPVLRTPQLGSGDGIQLIDAMNRPMILPYSFFSHWQTFEGLLKSTLGQPDVPGGCHIQKGSYLLNLRSRHELALTQHNWNTSIYPGCEVAMSVVFNALKLSLLRCPRPGCSTPPVGSIEDGSFITCSKCGLTYRFDRSIELPAPADEERMVAERQQNEDTRRFGQRDAPIDQADTFMEVEETEIPEADMYRPLRPEDYSFDPGLSSEKLPQLATSFVDDVVPAAPSMLSLNDAASGLERWLDTSALPMQEPAATEKGEIDETQQAQKELQDLTKLQRVHFTALAAETKPIVHAVPSYRHMPLESQIYLRKIVDKFPALPMPLAERFAKASLARKQRLKGLRSSPRTEPTDVGMDD